MLDAEGMFLWCTKVITTIFCLYFDDFNGKKTGTNADEDASINLPVLFFHHFKVRYRQDFKYYYNYLEIISAFNSTDLWLYLYSSSDSLYPTHILPAYNSVWFPYSCASMQFIQSNWCSYRFQQLFQQKIRLKFLTRPNQLASSPLLRVNSFSPLPLTQPGLHVKGQTT